MINKILEEQLGILEEQILDGLKKPCESKIIGQWHCILDEIPPFDTLVDVAILCRERYKNAFLEKTSVNGGKLIWRFDEDDNPNDNCKFFDDFYNPIVYWCFLPEIPNIYERFE